MPDACSAHKHPSHPLRVAFIGDPQVNDSTEMSYARGSIYRELAGRKDIDLAIFLGDLVNDNMALLPESVLIIDSLPYPCFMIPGNHDRDIYRQAKGDHGPGKAAAGARDLSTWKRVVGYVDTSFTAGGIRFILMNNIRPRSGGMSDYEGGFTQSQKHWLDSLLNFREGAPDGSAGHESPDNGQITVLATHIPFSQMRGRDSVLAMIPDLNKMLFVSGHTHSVARGRIVNDYRNGGTIATAEEIITGAACGSWWRGVKDGDGIPYALQNCGAPRGYFIANIHDDGRYSLDYKCIGKPDSEQLSVRLIEDKSYAGDDTADSNAGTAGSRDRRFKLFVNVYGGSPEGTVNVRLHGSRLMGTGLRRRAAACTLSSGTAPEVLEIIDANASATKDYRKAHRDEFIPLRKKPSSHLWESGGIVLQIDATAHKTSAVRISVRYRDPSMKIKCRRLPVTIP